MLRAFDRDNNIDHEDWDKRFSHDAEDTDLIGVVAGDTPKPVWVSADLSQRKNPAERLALARSGMSLVFFRAGFNSAFSFHQQAIKIVTVWPSVVQQCQTTRQPSVFEVSSKLHSEKVEYKCLTTELEKH
jgi:hypothetical protein